MWTASVAHTTSATRLQATTFFHSLLTISYIFSPVCPPVCSSPRLSLSPVYTHFIPALYIIYYIAFVFPTTSLGDPGQNAFLDRAINLTFLFASLACLMLSAAWHLAAGCGTLAVFHSCATLDYLGISSLISTSILTLTHQGFRCKHREGFYYNIAISAIGLLGLYLPWRPWFNRPDKKSARIAFFLAMSAAGTAPLFHFASLFGLHDTWKFYSPVLYSLIAYTLGLLFYAFDFPERVRPGGLCDTVSVCLGGFSSRREVSRLITAVT